MIFIIEHIHQVRIKWMDILKGNIKHVMWVLEDNQSQVSQQDIFKDPVGVITNESLTFCILFYNTFMKIMLKYGGVKTTDQKTGGLLPCQVIALLP